MSDAKTASGVQCETTTAYWLIHHSSFIIPHFHHFCSRGRVSVGHIQLGFIQPGVRARFLDQIVVVADLGNPPALDYYQPIGAAQRA